MRSNICGNGDALMMHRGVSVARQAEQAGPSDVPCTVTAARHTLALMVTAEGRTPARYNDSLKILRGTVLTAKFLRGSTPTLSQSYVELY
ncbi:hypothetical protein J6590_102123 [Homalodisca vitripennis]|nr:hypothetical protein J6590_102123 [Homalodisca vitripennis]